MKPKTKKNRKVMHKFKVSELNIGRSKKVKARKQASVIALSETTTRQDAIKETPVVDREALGYIRQGLQISVQGKISGITKCTVDDNGTFRGVFHQRLTPIQVKSFDFTFGEKEISFKSIEK